MGLKVDYKAAGKYTTIDVIRPHRVFSIPATIEELGGVNLAWREGNSPWRSHKNPAAELKKIFPQVKLRGLNDFFFYFLLHIHIRRMLSDIENNRNQPFGLSAARRAVSIRRLKMRLKNVSARLRSLS
jgi:hypothetical protein